MASDWTEERLEREIRTVARLAESQGMRSRMDLTMREYIHLLQTALDALRARPRWVAAGDFDAKTMRHVVDVTAMGPPTKYVLVVPLPLPPLPEEGE